MKIKFFLPQNDNFKNIHSFIVGKGHKKTVLL